MQKIINNFLWKNKSKQSNVWIDSIFEVPNICFGLKIVDLLDYSYNKHALVLIIIKLHDCLITQSFLRDKKVEEKREKFDLSKNRADPS